MSGHETIRVLEVEVDSSLASSSSEGKAGCDSEGEKGKVALEVEAKSCHTAANKAPSTGDSTGTEEASAKATLNQPVSEPVAVSVAPPQTSLPITVQACPQLLTQDSLATLMTGMMAPPGSLGQPLLIPLSMANSVAGPGGLAVLTLPTATVATLPGLATAATNPASNLLKLPFAGLPAATMLNSVQPQLQLPTQTLFTPQAAALQSVQAAIQTFAQSSTSAATAQVVTATTTAATPKSSEPSASMATLQTAGLSINPTIMIGTLPLLVNPATLAGGGNTPPLPTQGLQLQTVSPQLLLNAQGQIIATFGNTATQVPSSTAVMPKVNSIPLTLPKAAAQGPVVTMAQSPVVIAPQPSLVKTAPVSLASAVPLACGEAPTVGQLVSKPQQSGTDEECINLEEIREFAKNFKIRRLSLGLTQTQVGQALTATEGPAYSQSAICRFEKLDITPKSAQKLKPVLERWLAEAELWNQKGQQNLMEFVGGEPSKKRKRRTSFTPQAIEVLNSYFEKNALPTGQEITHIAKELNYDREVVRVWFCNRRQTLKNTSKINVFQVQQQQQQKH